MVFVPITDPQTEAGEPTAQELFKKIKDNDDDHESRISANETAVNKFVPIQFQVVGGQRIQDELMVERIFFDIKILSARIRVINAGTSGKIIVDIERSIDNGSSFSSIFSTLPEADFSDGDHFRSTTQVISVSDIDSGDLLRFNIDSIQVGNREFYMELEFESR